MLCMSICTVSNKEIFLYTIYIIYEYGLSHLCIITLCVLVLVFYFLCFFFFQAEDGIRDLTVTGVQTCALPISRHRPQSERVASGAACLAHLTDAYCVTGHEDSHRTIARRAGRGNRGRVARDRKSVV